MILCGTGHRPDKLGGYEGIVMMSRVFPVAYDYLKSECDSNDLVISGGALGWDQQLAAAAFRLGIPFHFYLPFPGFEDRWPQGSKTFFYALMHEAAEVKYICEPGYAGWKMQKRNEAMVVAADVVLALWNGTSGGTANCIRYAEKVGKPIINLWERFNRDP